MTQLTPRCLVYEGNVIGEPAGKYKDLICDTSRNSLVYSLIYQLCYSFYGINKFKFLHKFHWTCL